jgi:hypothetical protein
MTTLITLTLAGSDVGPFNIYSNLNGFTTPTATGISRSALVAGYTATLPDWTTQVLVKSTGVCPRDLYLNIAGAPTSTTTTSSTSSTTTTTTTVRPSITVSFQPFDKSFTILSTVAVPQTVFVGASTVDGYPNNSCSGSAIAGATLNGGILGLNVGGFVDTEPATGYSGPWFTTTPYKFSSPLITLIINGVSGAYSDGSTVTILGTVFTIYIDRTCI